MNKKEALLYEKKQENSVVCHLCAHQCLIREGRKGICQVRENQGGKLITLVYGRTIAQRVDLGERRLLKNINPGTRAYSMATVGCNFRCTWCQNADISQMPRERHFTKGEKASPEELVAAAQRTGSRSIAYTYTEPTIFFEYAYDTARLAKEDGLANLFITNGYMTEDMLEMFSPYLDAANVDLKAFRDDTYREYVGARLQPVLDSMKKMKDLGIWLEVTTLIIPGINDEEEEIRDAARFVAQELGPETPWHISRFHPAYKMRDRPATPLETLQTAQRIGIEEGLDHIYLGNVREETHTVCPSCGEIVIRRNGYLLVENRVTLEDACPACGSAIPGVGMGED